MMQRQTTPRNDTAESDFGGVLALARFLVAGMPLEVQSASASRDADLRSLFSTEVEKVIARMDGASPRRSYPSSQALPTVDLLSTLEHLARRPAPSNDTVLRVGPLALDLLDRTASRGDRRIDLRPREFQLLKYMMQRSDKLLTRAILFKEVWNYKFVPKTNLVDVHMGRLRRKVDGPNEFPLIRNIRGAGFVLSATYFHGVKTPRQIERADA